MTRCTRIAVPVVPYPTRTCEIVPTVIRGHGYTNAALMTIRGHVYSEING